MGGSSSVPQFFTEKMGGSSSKPQPFAEEEFKRSWAIRTSITWSPEEQERLKSSIKQRKVDRNNKPIKPKIWIFGPTGCGKSTLCNGFVTALGGDGTVASYFPAGSSAGTFTKGFHPYKCEDVWIIDMPGIFETCSITDENIRNIASGKVGFYQELTDILEVKDTNLPRPGKGDVACVVIVLSLGMEIPEQIKRMLACIMQSAGRGVVSYRLILTHADVCDERFKNPLNLPQLFDSKSIQDTVLKMASQTGIPSSAISVVRNYANDTDADLHTNILLLHALEKVVYASYQQVQKKDNMALMREMYEEDD